jgi:hypothetical protein
MDSEHGAATPFKWATATDGCCELLKAWLERGYTQTTRSKGGDRPALAQGTDSPCVIWLSVGKSFLALLHLGYLLHHLPVPETKVLVLRDIVMMELPICL